LNKDKSLKLPYNDEEITPEFLERMGDEELELQIYKQGGKI